MLRLLLALLLPTLLLIAAPLEARTVTDSAGRALGVEVLLLHEGRIAAQESPEDVLTPERLTGVYGIPVTVERTETGRLVCAPSLARAA